jgi:C-terminal processing protease CtpA/Prc
MIGRVLLRLFTVLILVATAVPALAQDDVEVPAAEIVNDEGGPVLITGECAYTNPFFTEGVAEPLVILEDQAGFVDRDRGFLMSPESQTIGQITSDFFTSPFTYSLALPIEPQGELRDVDNDAEEEVGVMVFTPAYWTNAFGDPFLEKRDLYGGGWSSAYAGTHVDQDPSSDYEIIGGKYVIYAPEEGQGFPSGFGDDGLLFTEDDPIVIVPQGYTIVDMDTDPFTFDRSAEVVIDLIEGEGSEVTDFSTLSYTEAFDAMVEKFRNEYAFTEYKGIDWDAMIAEFRPRFEEAEANEDLLVYFLAMRDFAWAIPDGHVDGGAFGALYNMFVEETEGGLGFAMRDVDDGRVIVNFVLDESPASEAGFEFGTEIIEMNGMPVDEFVDNAVAWSGPFSTPDNERLQKLRYALRFMVGEEVEVTFQNLGDEEPTTTTMTAIPERASFSFSSFNVGLTGYELPVEFEVLDSGYGYVSIFDFFDNEVLTVQLWERMIQQFQNDGIPAIIVDMRQNGGGSGFLADQLAAYFFDEEIVLGNNAVYDEELGEFYINPDLEDKFYPPAEELRFHGPVVVLVGPNCASACEFFSYDMTVNDRAAIVGQYPTGGLGGSVEDFYMPEGATVRFTVARAVDADGNIHIEGIGVVPTVQVPVTEETLMAEAEGGDPVLDAAVVYLDEAFAIEIIDGGTLAIGDTVEGELAPRTRVQYTAEVAAGDVVTILLGDETGEFDTVLRLYDVDGNLLAENDDFDDTTYNSGFEALEVPADMTIIVEAATYEDAGEGAYTIQVIDASGE